MGDLQPIQLQVLAAILFALGLATVMARRNLFFVLMGVELMLNAANLSFLSWSRTMPGAVGLEGQLAPIFAIAVAAAEACVGLAMLLSVFRSRESLDTDAFDRMKE
ncbi:MAG TPA: NADH-quinone oxidoreductase subunit NuoK [Fibrobacteria bacterium]|nr:NADH-quinone oxidoreductase subunit NuoK [Fibrobacteria bacterium]